MTNFESERFSSALKQLGFDDYEKEIMLKILSGSGNYNQEDILSITSRGVKLLRKLGWFRKFKLAVQIADLKIDFQRLI